MHKGNTTPNAQLVLHEWVYAVNAAVKIASWPSRTSLAGTELDNPDHAQE